MKKLFDRFGLPAGRSFGDEEVYMNTFPESEGLVFFDARMCTVEDNGSLLHKWQGDLDIVFDGDNIQLIANNSDREIAVVSYEGKIVKVYYPQRG